MYLDFLKKIAFFGHGVFSLNMIKDPKERNSLKVYINKNKSFFKIYTKPGLMSVYCLTNNFLKNIGIKDNILSKANTFDSMIDILLINAYMLEVDHCFRYENKPNLMLDILGKKIGIYSDKYGINIDAKDLDILLCTKKNKKILDIERKEFSEKLYVSKTMLI